MSGTVVALVAALSISVQEPSAADLRKQADEARAQYEILQARALKAEIAESEKALAVQQAALDAQRARLAALVAPAAASLPSTAQPTVAPPTTPIPLATTAPSAVADAAKTSGATVTTETSTTRDGTTVSQKTTATPFSQTDLQNGPSKRTFGGIEFGVGIAYTLDTGRYQRVRDAEVVNGIVRVTQSAQSSARIVLESHYFFTPERGFVSRVVDGLFGLKNTKEEMLWGFGPFVALQPGTDNVIDAIGTGIMIGLRRSQAGTDSFNLGIGGLVDINEQTLGNGIFEDRPLPAGDTLRFKRRSQLGLLLMSSYSF